MALKIKFANKTEVAYLNAVETEEYFNGASRRTLSFEIAPGAIGLDKLNALCTEANCATLQLINEEEGVTNIYEGYVLKLKLGVEPALVSAETPEAPAVYEERVKLKLGKRTYIEEQLHKMGIN